MVYIDIDTPILIRAYKCRWYYFSRVHLFFFLGGGGGGGGGGRRSRVRGVTNLVS